MVLENQLPPFFAWWGDAALNWILVLAVLGIGGLFVGYLSSAMRLGPVAAGDAVYRALMAATWDVFSLSPRRVWAMARLSLKETRQSKAFVGFLLFGAFVMFANWFMPRDASDHVKLTTDRIFWVVTFLVWTSAVLLSCFSIPNDIVRKTVYTIVTKPVRSSEIVLGRIVGFSLIGAILVSVMGLVSYLFVRTSSRHEHGLSNVASGETDEAMQHRHRFSVADDLEAYVGFRLPTQGNVPGDGRPISSREADDPARLMRIAEVERDGPADQGGIRRGDVLVEVQGVKVASRRAVLDALEPLAPGQLVTLKLQRGQKDSVTVEFPIRPWAFTSLEAGHYHLIDRIEIGPNEVRYEVGPALEQFHARKPEYGQLRFRDPQGNEEPRGVNVGEEWSYRSYLEGGGQAAAIWKFSGLKKEDYPDGLPIEMTLRVFRTHQGDVNKGVLGTIELRNPRTGERSDPHIFESVEFGTYRHEFDKKIPDPDRPGQMKETAFDTFVSEDGELEVELQCTQNGQYFGVAMPDLYLIPDEGKFEWTVVKAYFVLWLQMVVISSFGVMFSTFLNGSVSLLATTFITLGGFVKGLMLRMAMGEQVGGGPMESLFRVVRQTATIGDLEPGLSTDSIKLLDVAWMPFFRALGEIVPSLPEMSCSQYLVNGYDVPWNVVIIHACTALAYLLPLFLLGLIFFKLREVAK